LLTSHIGPTLRAIGISILADVTIALTHEPYATMFTSYIERVG